MSNPGSFVEDDPSESVESVVAQMMTMKTRLKYKSNKVVGNRKMTTMQANLQASLLQSVMNENEFLKQENNNLRGMLAYEETKCP